MARLPRDAPRCTGMRKTNLDETAGPLQRVFAYGSNLCLGRMLARAPGAVVVATAALPGHALRWHKRGRDGSGKCDALATGVEDDVVHGAVYAMNAQDKGRLDRFEGLGRHYFGKTVWVRTTHGDDIDAFVYVANPDFVDARAVPWSWYKAFVVSGAKHHGLPADYVAGLEATVALPDPDRARERRETAVLSPTG